MASAVVTIIIVVVGLIALYYLYQYLFSANITTINAITSAQPGNKAGAIITGLPPLYQGGQFSISTWVYVNSIKVNTNSPILVLGGNTYDTLRVYIGPNGQLCVRTSAGNTNLAVTDGTFAPLAATSYNAVPCDIPTVDLQRWIHIVVAMNGSLCDVYMDGKLVRSCTLVNYFNVDAGPSLKITPGSGFGGVISTTNVYGIALSPDIVYANYMAGPKPITNFYEYLVSFFQPSPTQ